MRKQAMACLLIGTMAILALTIPTLHIVSAKEDDIDGQNFGYWDSIANSKDPWFCECNHLIWQGDLDDSEAGISLTASYSVINGVPMFTWAQWWFQDESGGQLATQWPGMGVDACLNGGDHHWYWDYSPPQYTIPPLANYYCWNVQLPAQGNIDPVYSVEGRTVAYFYDPTNPDTSWSVEAYTQNPAGQQGNGWSYLTATW